MSSVEIRGDANGLRAMAASCQRHAAALNTGFVPPVQGPAFQATSRSIIGVNTKAHLVERAIIVRMDATAAKATVAASNYEMAERNSATGLQAVP